MKKILAVIPARGGSKGVKRKNIFPLMSKPLIYYSIKAALNSKLISNVVVSTEDEEIMEISRSFGAEVPFKRPYELATDLALAVPTIKHAVLEVERIKNFTYDYVIMLQPTTPLRNQYDVDTSLKKLIYSEADSIISVVDVHNWHPMKMKLIEDGFLVDYQSPRIENIPRQLLPKVYITNGAIYATKRNVLVNDSTFKGNSCIPYIMPEERSVNIDSEKDFIIAEYYLRKK